MEDKKAEEFARSILSDSRVEIENPEFNKTLMNKIRKKTGKKILINNFKYYSLIFIGTDILIISLLRLFNMRITDIPGRLNNLPLESLSGQLIPVYLTFLIVSFLIIRSVSGNGYIPSKTYENTE